MRHKHRDLRFSIADGACDLRRRQHQAARRMQDDVEGNVFVRESDGTQHLLGVIHIDIAHDGKAK
jgi:hypothetical protein